MNTQELRNKIDSILGNSMRVLLPSYWWKRLFHAVVDEIDDVRSTANSKANKSEVASLSNSVDALSDKVDDTSGLATKEEVKTYELNLVNLNTFDKIEAAIAALNLPDNVDITRQLKITDNYANHLIIQSDLYPLANISESVITFNCMQGLRIIAKKEDQSVNRMMCSDAIIHIGTTDGNYKKNNTAIFPSTVKDPTEAFADFSIHYHTKDNTLIKCRPLNVLRGYETSEEEPTYYQFDVIVNGCRETWRVNSDGSCICEQVENIADLTEEIITNEEVHAAALNDLNARIKELEERLNSAGL